MMDCESQYSILALGLKISSHLFSLIQHTVDPSESEVGARFGVIFRDLKSATCAAVLETVVTVLSIPQAQSPLGPEWSGAHTVTSNSPKPQTPLR